MEPNTNPSLPPINPNQIQNTFLEGPVNLFSSSWQFFKTNWKILVSITVLPMAMIYAGQIFYLTANSALWFIGFILVIAGLITSIAMSPAAINAIHRLTTEAGACRARSSINYHYLSVNACLKRRDKRFLVCRKRIV